MGDPVAPDGRAELAPRALRADAGDLELLRDCFARNSERPRSPASLAWQYRDNLGEGRVFVDVAEAPGGQRLAAVYASLPGWMRIAGQRRLVVQSLDTLTDAEFRGRGLFVKLARRTYQRAADQGVALVYGFPNGNSVHGFTTKLGWHTFDPVPFLIRPLRLRYVASKLPRLARVAGLLPDLPLALPWTPALPGTRVVELDRFDERATALWDAFRATGVRVALDRDAAYLNWRLAEKPGESYRTLAIERGDRLDALCTFCVKDKHGGRVAYIMELLHRPEAGLAASLLLARCVGELARSGADAILAWCLDGSPNRAAYRHNGFVVLPERLRPIELHVGVRAFDPAIDALVRDRAAWYLSYLDSDTV